MEQRRARASAREQLAIAWHTARFTVMGIYGKLPPMPTLSDGHAPQPSIGAQMNALSRVIGIVGVPATPETDAAFWRPREHGQ